MVADFTLSTVFTSVASLAEGSFWLVLFFVLLGLTIWRFDWLVKRFPRMLYWGRSPWGFPASRYGVATWCLIGITIGLGPVGFYFHFLSRGAWYVMLMATLAIAFITSIYDYIRHRSSAEDSGE